MSLRCACSRRIERSEIERSDSERSERPTPFICIARSHIHYVHNVRSLTRNVRSLTISLRSMFARSLLLCRFAPYLRSCLAAHIHYVHICSFTIRCAHCSLFARSLRSLLPSVLTIAALNDRVLVRSARSLVLFAALIILRSLASLNCVAALITRSAHCLACCVAALTHA
jgi:hypothetical protein